MIEEKRNYLKEFYDNKDKLNLSSILNKKDIDEIQTIKDLKREIQELQKMLDNKSLALSKEIDKNNGGLYEPIKGKILLKYTTRHNQTYYYDFDSGLSVDFYDNNETIYDLNTKKGVVRVVVGYNYEMASIIVKTYDYNINTDNTQVILKPINQVALSFMEDKASIYKVKDNIILDNVNSGLYEYTNTLYYVKNNEFINKFYGIDYQGKLALRDLRHANLTNKSFEIIIKQAPSTLVDTLIKKDIKETLPIHEIIGVSKDTYNKALKNNCVDYLYDCIKYIKTNNLGKTENEWLNIVEECKAYEEDLNFYGIKVGNYYYSSGNLLSNILDYYISNDQILMEYYTLGKLINYVVNETINQGYTSITSFLSELRDYLRMCKSDNIKPTLYSSYLKQTHDITSRNHKIKVEREGEEMFKSRYEDFKEFKSSNNYYVIAPTETKDLQKEGDNLNHCVASYIKRVIDASCLIYFLRKNKEESLITFEVRNNAIVQVKGSHNRRPHEEERKALEEFAKDREMEVRF